MTTAIGKPKQTLDTPVLIVDLDAMERNVDRISTTCQAAGVNWRPHMKGIEVPAIAHRVRQRGAIGITCAKLGEAEVMAGAGITDILIANQIVGDLKIARLVNLRRHADIIVCVDSDHGHQPLQPACTRVFDRRSVCPGLG
jgi:D-serine deaminase-like pyridoxal phosphate-dependent protein